MTKWGSVGAVAVSTLAIAATLAAGAGASSGCGAKKAFARFGDAAPYTLLVGGDIEAPGWEAAGSPSVVGDNEPFFLSSKADGHSLRLASGDGATFHAACVERLKPRIRFLARASGGEGSLRVDVRYENRTGPHTVTVATLDATSFRSWAPTDPLTFLNPKARLASQITGTVHVTLRPSGAAVWQVDDLYIDPYLRR